MKEAKKRFGGNEKSWNPRPAAENPKVWVVGENR